MGTEYGQGSEFNKLKRQVKGGQNKRQIGELEPGALGLREPSGEELQFSIPADERRRHRALPFKSTLTLKSGSQGRIRVCP